MPFLSEIFSSLRKIFRGKPRRRKRSRAKPRVLKKPRRREKLDRRKVSSPRPSKKSKKTVAGRVRLAHNTPKQAVSGPSKAVSVEVGGITHFFPKIRVVVVKITKGVLKSGDRVQIKGNKTDFIQKVASMQVESVDVKTARKGQLIGLKVDRPADAGDRVYRIA